MSKVVDTCQEAVSDITDGASVMIGGFGVSGVPHGLVNALAAGGARDLSVICNGVSSCAPLAESRRMKRLLCSYGAWTWRSRPNPLAAPFQNGELEIEVIPQGTLAERIRAGGYGIEAFYVPVGVNTGFAEGKRIERFGNRDCVLETALRADFALIKAFKADRMGNLVYHGSARNFNPVMAAAAKRTIVEVEEIVPLGGLDPESVVTPGIFVDTVVKVAKPPPVWMYRPDRS